MQQEKKTTYLIFAFLWLKQACIVQRKVSSVINRVSRAYITHQHICGLSPCQSEVWCNTVLPLEIRANAEVTVWVCMVATKTLCMFLTYIQYMNKVITLNVVHMKNCFYVATSLAQS